MRSTIEVAPGEGNVRGTLMIANRNPVGYDSKFGLAVPHRSICEARLVIRHVESRKDKASSMTSVIRKLDQVDIAVILPAGDGIVVRNNGMTENTGLMKLPVCRYTSEPSRLTEPVADVAVGVNSLGKGSRAAESNARMEGLQAEGTDLYARAWTGPANTKGVNVVVRT